VIADVEREGPDLVLQAGDLALSGPRPAEVIDRIRALGWPGVLGNTDELLWRPEARAEQEARAPKLKALFASIFDSHAPATRERLGEERIAWLRELPSEVRRDGIRLVHASPGDLWRAPMPDADDEELASVYGNGEPVAVYGHIHRPYVRELPGLTVANSGSVGMPFDGDWRASYLLVEDGSARVKRVEYDLDGELSDLESSGYPDAERLAETRRAGRFVSPRSP
jgi:diadenosine tetraphosphatase ApaH/serine/threonine PP2A family protein phosphatase